RAGEHSLAQPTGEEQFSVAVATVVHPGYENGEGATGHTHDLMLLRVDPPFTLSPFVQPVALPSSPVATGANCTVMGWGTTTSPQGT
ncbi:TRY1 protein, partial [Glaucidium brasilianum]|nr:TRY1 protein [Glaucidium brasilianum]